MSKILLFFVCSWICISCYKTVVGSVLNNTLIQPFITDFFNYKQTNYFFLGCWKKEKLVNLMKQSSQNYYKQIYRMGKLNIPDFSVIRRRWIVLDLITCDGYEDIIYDMSEANLFGYPAINFMFLLEANKYKNVINASENYHLYPINEVVLAFFSENSVNLYQLYKLKKELNINIEIYGKWSLESGVELFYNGVEAPSRRFNFYGLPVKVGCVVFKDYGLMKKDPLTYDDILRSDEFMFKLDYLILTDLGKALNGTPVVVAYNSHGYGKINETTGNYTGPRDLLSGIFYGDIHVAGTVFMTYDRNSVVKLAAPMKLKGLKFILKKPSLSFMKNIYYITFEGHVWYAVAVVTLIFSFAFFAIFRYERKLNKGQWPVDSKVRYSWSDIILMSLEAVSQQGTTYDPRTCSSSILTLMFFTLFMFLYVAYSAMILVMLRSTVEVKDWYQLLDSRIECGGHNYHFTKYYFESPKSGVLRKLYLKKIYPNNYYNLEDGMKRVQDGNFAFHSMMHHCYEYITKHFSNDDVCMLQELPGYANTRAYHSIKHKTPLKEVFQTRMLRLKEIGCQSRSHSLMTKTPQCHSDVGGYTSISIYDCYCIFALFGYLGLLSILFLMLEILAARYRHIIIIKD